MRVGIEIEYWVIDADTVRTLRLRAADALERDLESLRKHEPEASVPAMS